MKKAFQSQFQTGQLAPSMYCVTLPSSPIKRNNSVHFSLLLLLTVGALRAPGVDQSTQAIAQADKEFTKAEHIFPLAEETSGRLTEERDKYLAKRKWELGISKKNPNGAYIGWGEAPIHSDPKNKTYAQSRVMAFERALTEARGDFVKFQQMKTSTETIKRFFDDSREPSEEEIRTEKGRLKVIAQKTLALTEAELDKKLKALNVDPSKFEKLSVDKKRNLMTDEIRKENTAHALKSVAGLRVLATFEDLRSIGVLVVYSDNMRELAISIARGETTPAPTDNHQEAIAKQIEDACPRGASDLVHTLGVRVMTDDSGNRALVAFGQWSPAVTTLDSRLKRDTAVKAARMTARVQAEGALTDFINSTLVLDTRALAEEAVEINKITSSSEEREQETARIGSLIAESIKQYGHAKLEGVTTIKDWTGNHPETGHLIVGHVLMWSASTRDAAVHGIDKILDAAKRDDRKAPLRNNIRTSPDLDKKPDF
jgi:hypothetical protein